MPQHQAAPGSPVGRSEAAALAGLLTAVQRCNYDSSGFAGVVVSCTGMYGEQRELLRRLCRACGLRHEPSLVRGWTTHLVCCSPAVAAQRSEKLPKALSWGIPAVSLRWLLDSVAEGEALPVEGYLVQLPPGDEQAEAGTGAAAEAQPGLAAVAAGGVQLLGGRQPRPSSVASNQQPGGAAAPGGEQASPRPAPLSPVDNVLAQLQAASISPKPQGPAAQRGPVSGVPPAAAAAADSSPEQSLSFQHLVGAPARSASSSPITSRLAKPPPGTSMDDPGEEASPLPLSQPSPMLTSPCGQQDDSKEVGSLLSSPGRGRGKPSLSPLSDFSMDAASTASTPQSVHNGGGGGTSPGASLGGEPEDAAMGAAGGWSDGEPSPLEQQRQQQRSPESPGSGLKWLPGGGGGEPDSPCNLQPDRGHSGLSPEQLTQREPVETPPAAGSPSSGSLHLPASAQLNRITSRRPRHHQHQHVCEQEEEEDGEREAPAPAAGHQAAAGRHKTIADWTDDESDGFPTPPDPRLRRLTADVEAAGPQVIARPPPSAAALPLKGSEVGIKLLKAAPRGNCVREHHGLATLKRIQFAEQVQVAQAGVVLSSKEKKTAAKLRARPAAGAGEQDAASDNQVVLAEPATFYQLPDGVWYLEYSQLYTAEQADRLAARQGVQLVLPAGFDRDNELLKSTARQYARLDDVTGAVTVRRVKTDGTMLRLKGGGAGAGRNYFWRCALDPATAKCVTDRPAKDFLDLE